MTRLCSPAAHNHRAPERPGLSLQYQWPRPRLRVALPSRLPSLPWSPKSF